MGSSPRVRGAEARHAVDGVAVGIIPARAGSSSPCTTVVMVTGDHPRACGEQLALIAFYFGKQGSSPRVRGAAAHQLATGGV